jgi:hypothetical protein
MLTIKLCEKEKLEEDMRLKLKSKEEELLRRFEEREASLQELEGKLKKERLDLEIAVKEKLEEEREKIKGELRTKLKEEYDKEQGTRNKSTSIFEIIQFAKMVEATLPLPRVPVGSPTIEKLPDNLLCFIVATVFNIPQSPLVHGFDHFLGFFELELAILHLK